jgi:hypothetical protein
MTNEYSIDSITLRQRIEALPEDCILFRSDFPEYHTEFVGSILSELTTKGILVKCVLLPMVMFYMCNSKITKKD